MFLELVGHEKARSTSSNADDLHMPRLLDRTLESLVGVCHCEGEKLMENGLFRSFFFSTNKDDGSSDVS
jgi:hypothetical protein